ncbi:MAG: 5-formyltetrahydrofolate cyclo-ligase [Rhodanobacter sp.]
MDALARRREFRQQMAERRRALPPTVRVTAAQGLRRTLEQLPEYFTDAHVAGYWAVDGELPLNLVIPPLAARGQQFLLPMLKAGRLLVFVPWQTGDRVKPNRHGIPEPVDPETTYAPAQVDLVLVPLLGFDRQGHRLGQGGGYYDRSFGFLQARQRPTEPLLVGVAYTFQELPRIEAEAWDVSLDFVATERELIACNPAPSGHEESA